MNINDYILQLEAIINSFSLISSYNLAIDRKSDEIVFISGRIDFRNGTTLDFKEFIESTEKGIEKYMYGYNYRSGSHAFFRYDNAPDPGAKGVKSFPHHKHLENASIVESAQIDLSDVLNEIEKMYPIEDKDE